MINSLHSEKINKIQEIIFKIKTLSKVLEEDKCLHPTTEKFSSKGHH